MYCHAFLSISNETPIYQRLIRTKITLKDILIKSFFFVLIQATHKWTLEVFLFVIIPRVFNCCSFPSILYVMSLSLASYIFKFQLFVVNFIFWALIMKSVCQFWDQIQSFCLFASWRIARGGRIERSVYLHYKPKIPFAFPERLSLSRPALSIRKVSFFISQYHKVKCAIFMDKALTLSQKWKSIGKRREIDGLQWRVPFKTQLSTKQARNVRCKHRF